LKIPFSVALAIGVGFVVLLGYFFDTNAAGELTLLGLLRNYFLDGAVAVAGVAVLVGVANLVSVHLKKIRSKQNEGYSFLLLLAMIITLGVGIFDIIRTYQQAEPGLSRTRWIFEYIQLPLETSLMAVLAISLTYAAARLLGRRMDFLSALFVGVVLVLLLTTLPQLVSQVTWLGDLRTWIVTVPAVGGARGILLGVALGTIATGVRILLGGDRPYGG
jgi:cytochrome bd-type quinol oxidase subunit 2